MRISLAVLLLATLARAEDDPVVGKLSLGKLTTRVKRAPTGPAAAAAMRELSRRGEKGWERLEMLVAQLWRKQAYVCPPIIAALANGPEPERRALLAGLLKKVRAAQVRLAILNALEPHYPENADLLHAGLKLDVDGRVELMRKLAKRGLPDDVLKGCLQDEGLVEDAYAILLQRKTEMKADELALLARRRAREGRSPEACRAFAVEFKRTRDWELLEAFVRLLGHKEVTIAEGAYMLILTVSGKDIAPDADLWRSWLSVRKENYEPPGFGEPGPVTAAILRARAFLRQDLLDDGASIWPTSPDWPGTKVGATALSVLALRAAGVPRDDKAIVTAVDATLLRGGAMRDDLDGYTYALSLLAMALEAVDRTKHREVLEVLGRRLTDGQLENGQWTYNCRRPDYERRPKAGDNSNTQFALLGLRSVQRSGLTVDPEAWKKSAAFWLRAINAFGGWGYGPKGSFHHEMSMTAAGISSVTICAEALHGPKAVSEVRRSKRVSMGLLRLGELLLQKGYKDEEIYTLYGVERACILTGTRMFNDFDWYKTGAALLVETQKESGAWGDNTVRGVTTGLGYGEAVDTAFALLFLKRATTRLAGMDAGGVVKVPRVKRPVKPR